MKRTTENGELVTAECARLTSIGYLTDEALAGYVNVCLRHFPGPDSVSDAVSFFLDTCDKIPPPVAFVRYAGALATKAPICAYCATCRGTGFEERLEMRQTLDGLREVAICYYCRCRAVEGQATAPPAEAQAEPFDPAYNRASYRQQLIADGCDALVALLDAQPATAEGSVLSRLAAASQQAKQAIEDKSA